MNKERLKCETNTENECRENNDFNTRGQHYKHVDSTQKYNESLKF